MTHTVQDKHMQTVKYTIKFNTNLIKLSKTVYRKFVICIYL